MLPSFWSNGVPIEKRIRVEIFLPLRSDLLSYQVAIDWMAEEFARQRGGATLTAPFAGLFASASHADLVEDAIRILFSDFQLDIENQAHTTQLVELLDDVKKFLTETLEEEEIWIVFYPISRVP